MALLDFFGTTPDYLGGLLGSDLDRYRQDANQQALQAAALGLLQAGAPSATPGGGALAIARGLQMGQQAYKSALREGVQERLAGMQMQDFLRKQEEQQAVRRFLPNIIQQVPGQQMIYNQPSQVIRDEEGNMMPGATVGQPTQRINQQALQQLALVAPEQFGRISAGLKALAPEYKEVGGQLYEIPQFGGTPTAVAGQPKRETVTVGNVVLDKNTMQPIYTAPETQPSAIKEYQYAVSQGYPGSFAQFQQEQKKAGASIVNVGEKTFTSEFGKGVAQNVENTFNNAQGAVATLTRIETLKPLVSDGKVFSGPLSGATQVVTRMADSLGIAGADATEKLRNTAVAMQQLAGLELNAAEQMKGQGAITENERQLIKRAAAGDLTQMTAGEVNSLLGALEKTSKFKINAHNKNLERLRKNPATAELADYYNLETVQPTQTPTQTPTPAALPSGVRVRRIQ